MNAEKLPSVTARLLFSRLSRSSSSGALLFGTIRLARSGQSLVSTDLHDKDIRLPLQPGLPALQNQCFYVQDGYRASRQDHSGSPWLPVRPHAAGRTRVAAPPPPPIASHGNDFDHTIPRPGRCRPIEQGRRKETAAARRAEMLHQTFSIPECPLGVSVNHDFRGAMNRAAPRTIRGPERGWNTRSRARCGGEGSIISSAIPGRSVPRGNTGHTLRGRQARKNGSPH
jgi:hypothetical protein